MVIRYFITKNEWDDYSALVERLVLEVGARVICDVGGGANPVLSTDFIRKYDLEYVLMDISVVELQKAPDGITKIIQDIEAENIDLPKKFDLVVTKMLAEHLRNGEAFHRNIANMLKPGGLAIHYFPTLYALPFLINKFVSSRVSSFLLRVFLPRDLYQTGKFPAYYSFCFGPTPLMLKMLTERGYEIIEFRGYFGNRYWSKVPIVSTLQRFYSLILSRFPIPYLTSFAQVILRKPEAPS